jgi:hypothetical protein
MLWMHHKNSRPKQLHEHIPILWIRQIPVDYISAKLLCLENILSGNVAHYTRHQRHKVEWRDVFPIWKLQIPISTLDEHHIKTTDVQSLHNVHARHCFTFSSLHTDRQPLFYASTFQFSSANWYNITSASNHSAMPLTRTERPAWFSYAWALATVVVMTSATHQRHRFIPHLHLWITQWISSCV